MEELKEEMELEEVRAPFCVEAKEFVLARELLPLATSVCACDKKEDCA